MTSKRAQEDEDDESFSDDGEDMLPDYDDDYQPQHQKYREHGRSKTYNDSCNAIADEDDMSPAQAAAVAANVPGSASGRRRGRGPSKKPCLNRNAQMARENRQRKKVYLQNIEERLNEYHAKNKSLAGIIEKQNKQIENLASNVRYFQALVANQSEITTLLVALNEAIKALHGSKDTVTSSLSDKVATALKNVNKTMDGYKWSSAPQDSATLNVNNQSAPVSGTLGAAISSQFASNFGKNNQAKIARKTMPLTMASGASIKTDEPSSVESLFVDDNEMNNFVQSPESHSYCEYNLTDTNSAGLGSCSINGSEASPTDLDALDSFVFDSAPESPADIQLHDQHDDFLNNINVETPKISADEVDDLLGINETSRFNRTLFNTLNPPTGICLHINSCRVSLEYCHFCYKRSLAQINDSPKN